MTTAERGIVAIGGGGFSEDRDPELDAYVLAQARSPRPAVAFLGTASGDAATYLAKFHAAFARLDCRPSHLGFFGRTPDLAEFVRAQDVLYVGGGNTRSLLAVWREWGLPSLLRDALREGTVLAGISAGAICWFEQGITDSSAGVLGPLPGLGLLPGSCCPHYASEPERRPAYHRLVEAGEVAPGIAIDDGVAVHFVGGKVHQVLSARSGATAHRVERGAAGVRETALPAVQP